MNVTIVAGPTPRGDEGGSRDPLALSRVLRTLGQRVTLAEPPRDRCCAEERSPDVVLSVGIAAPIGAAILAQTWQVPLVVALPGGFPTLPQAAGYVRLVCRHLPVACFLVESERVCHEVERIGAPPHQVFVVPPGVPIEGWSPRPVADQEPVSVLCDTSAATLATHRFLATVLDRLRTERGHAVRAVVCTGDGADQTAAAAIWAGSPHHEILSRPGTAELAARYTTSDIVLLPAGTTDGTMAAIRAQAAGRPLLAVDLPAVQDVVTSARHGMLAEPGNVDEWLDKLDYLVAEAPLRQHLGRSARLNAELSFSLARTAQLTSERLAAVCAAWRYLQ